MIAHFSYQNDGDDSVKIAIGDANTFTPGNEDIGQPTEFFKGRVNNIAKATIPAGASLRWILGDAFVDADITTMRCEPAPLNCTDINIKNILTRLDSNTANLSRIVKRISKRILAVTSNRDFTVRAETFIARAESVYLKEWTDIWGRFPQIAHMCPECSQIDMSNDIEIIIKQEQLLYRFVQLAARTLKKVESPQHYDDLDELLARADRLDAQFTKTVKSLPRFLSNCE